MGEAAVCAIVYEFNIPKNERRKELIERMCSPRRRCYLEVLPLLAIYDVDGRNTRAG